MECTLSLNTENPVINIYGSRISYYAGKLETYLRYRSIEYQLLPMAHHAREILAGTGAVQSPTVKLEAPAGGSKPERSVRKIKW